MQIFPVTQTKPNQVHSKEIRQRPGSTYSGEGVNLLDNTDSLTVDSLDEHCEVCWFDLDVCQGRGFVFCEMRCGLVFWGRFCICFLTSASNKGSDVSVQICLSFFERHVDVSESAKMHRAVSNG